MGYSVETLLCKVLQKFVPIPPTLLLSSLLVTKVTNCLEYFVYCGYPLLLGNHGYLVAMVIRRFLVTMVTKISINTNLLYLFHLHKMGHVLQRLAVFQILVAVGILWLSW